MISATIMFGSKEWIGVAAGLFLVALVVLTWAYIRLAATGGVRVVCFFLKFAALTLIGVCLLEPLWVGSRPRPGSNLFLVVADNSRSMQLAGAGSGQSRGAAMKASLVQETGWLTRLAQDFDVRKYSFDTRLKPIEDFSDLAFTGESSSLIESLAMLEERYRGQPVAGILVLTDGSATDVSDRSWKEMPPIFPVALATETPMIDVAVAEVAVSQTNFEAAPVTIVAQVKAIGIENRKVVVRVLNEKGTEVERQAAMVAKSGDVLSQRFLIKPDRTGVAFYQVHAALEGEESLAADSTRSTEATLANNRRYATVDRGGGPYRVLYVSGMPNWEFKFLRRAIANDDEVELVGLVRIAKKEPKFTFLSRDGERTNPLFRGFGNKNEEDAEQYDEPVLLRLGTKDKDELRGGFPKDADELYQFHAVILDDIEAGFFTQDQMSLLHHFVTQRGGGLLMMGGKNSFGEGGFARTPVAEMLPVYLDRELAETANSAYRIKLTREGWLQPWVRVRANEPDEQERLAAMPGFRSLNRISSIKPGASVLAEAETDDGTARPALAVQPFSRGRTAALLVGDLWRWELRRPDHEKSDLDKAWRQMVRWLVADVPKRVEVETKAAGGSGLVAREIVVKARDAKFAPLDNAQISLTVTTPENREITLAAESSDQTGGEYRAQFAPRSAGFYRAKITATAPDGSEVGQREAGWSAEPETDEFRDLSGNRALLDRLAADSGGAVSTLDGLEQFVTDLPNRKLPIVETWAYPLWHQWSVLMLAMGCLAAEWGLRRWRGLP